MKLKLKALAAASAMLFASGAFAAINNAETGTTAGPANYAGGSDLVFYAWSAGQSYVQDLGVSMGAFQPSSGAANMTQVFSLLNPSAYSQLTGTINWGVAAVHSNTTVPTALGQDYLFTTVNANVPATGTGSLAVQTNVGVKNTVGAFDGFANFSGTTAGGYYDNATDQANWATSLQNKIGPSSLVFSATNAVGASGIEFLMIDTPNASTTQKTTVQTAFAGTFGFDGTALTYAVAAVPEPGTYAMLLAGLMMIGGIARRRTQG